MRRELTEKRGRAVRGMFGRIAHRYDLLNHLLSLGLDRRWRRALARRVAAAAPEVVLDVCTGTGDVALALPAGPRLLAADFCLPMLARARRKAGARRLGLVAADALRLPLAADAVDLVTVAFGVRNFEDLEAGLGELVRVVRPGGAALVLEFSQPRGAMAPLLRWWSRTVPPRVGRWLSGDPDAYSYLPATVAEFPDSEAMTAVLTRVGLEGVRAHRLTGGVATLYEGRRPASAAAVRAVAG